MFDILENLCRIYGASGNEEMVREYILSEIEGFAEAKVDALGNIIAFKKGENTPAKKIMLDAHMDEVGIIVTDITAEGFLRFSTVGGIKASVLLCRRVVFENGVNGVISLKPIHLLSGDEGKTVPKEDSLYIDIGAASRAQAEEMINIGSFGVLEGEYIKSGNNIKSRALDDRIGCAVLIDLIKSKSQYDFYAVFSVQEEVGARGAKTAAYAVEPDFSIVLEGTTANDIADTPYNKQVCELGKGAAVSFMDSGTLYDRELFSTAINSGIPCQIKRANAGGNNAGSIHLTKNGVRTIAISVPCRYIHSPSSVANTEDIKSARRLAEYLINAIGRGTR
ncbi:MAG: M42 family peptidase [Clostridiales bacterium]|nr:M42 family peptidase [Candidatus Equinaster intestinalis]